MEPSDRNNHEDIDTPAWERDPVVRRALALALEPSRDGARATRAALEQLRGVLEARAGNVAIRKGGRVLSSGRVSKRENSAERGGRGIGGLGGQTLRKGLWVSVFAATMAGVFLIARRGGEHHMAGAHVYTTGAAQQALVDLDDGTRVTLAPNTTLRIPQFTTSARTVVLESGEAYFEVAHGSASPFVVRSGEFTTRVLGTAFLLRHTRKTPRMQVAVTEGRVRVTSETHQNVGVTLEAGAIGEVTDSTVREQKIDALASGTEWRNDQLIFHHTTVSAVLQTLSQWYGYQFRCADSALARQDITIGVSLRSSAAAFATLEDILSVNLTVIGDTITLTSQPAPQSKRAPRIRTYDVWTPTREVGR